jgi:hypothetical protein
VRVLYALLCEEAEARPDGRIDAQGIFHQLYAPAFPAQQDRMVLVVNLEWAADEVGRNEFRIDLLDASGSPGLTINGHTDVEWRVEADAPPPGAVGEPAEQRAQRVHARDVQADHQADHGGMRNQKRLGTRLPLG